MNEKKERELTPNIQKTLNLSDKERKKIIQNGIWVIYPQVEMVFKTFEKLLEQPKKTRVIGRSISGESGIGKTILYYEFENMMRLEKGIKENDSFFEVLCIRMPEISDVKSLYIEIGRACYLYNLPRSRNQLKDAIFNIMHTLNVKMLFIDEFHNILYVNDEKTVKQCLNAIKGLADQLHIPIVLLGTPQIINVIKSDKQFLKRYPIIELKRFEYDDTFKILLRSFEAKLPLKQSSNLHEEEISKLIYKMSEGLIDRIAYILKEAAMEAIRTGTERITIEILRNLKI